MSATKPSTASPSLVRTTIDQIDAEFGVGYAAAHPDVFIAVVAALSAPVPSISRADDPPESKASMRVHGAATLLAALRRSKNEGLRRSEIRRKVFHHWKPKAYRRRIRLILAYLQSTKQISCEDLKSKDPRWHLVGRNQRAFNSRYWADPQARAEASARARRQWKDPQIRAIHKASIGSKYTRTELREAHIAKGMEWLQAQLTTGPKSARELTLLARQQGIGWKTLVRAKNRMPNVYASSKQWYLTSIPTLVATGGRP